MKTNEGSCAIRENELPQLRPNDTNSAQTGASCSVNWCRYSVTGKPGRRGCTGGCSGRRIPEKEIRFYTIEASMSMKTNDGSCTIRENELPQMRPNDTNSAKTCCLFALFARWVQSSVCHRRHGERFALRLSRKPRHSRASGNPSDRQWVPAFAGTTLIFIASGGLQAHRYSGGL
jgi:hypothetical protein